MKHTMLLSFAAMAAISFTSCGEGNNEETAADTTVAMEATPTATNEVVYYDLSTGTALRKDEASGRYVDESGTPAKFYVDVQSRDTFYGATGQSVSNALIRDNGDWRVDDAKVKITEDKMVVQDDDSKLKVKDEKTKLITDDQKVKVTDKNNDGVKEVKVKNR